VIVLLIFIVIALVLKLSGRSANEPKNTCTLTASSAINNSKIGDFNQSNDHKTLVKCPPLPINGDLNISQSQSIKQATGKSKRSSSLDANSEGHEGANTSTTPLLANKIDSNISNHGSDASDSYVNTSSNNIDKNSKTTLLSLDGNNPKPANPQVNTMTKLNINICYL
jgi:hypothetical protein